MKGRPEGRPLRKKVGPYGLAPTGRADLKVISLDDKDAGGKEFELKEIDPFTFFASFYSGIKNVSRKAILEFLKTSRELQAEAPDDFNGARRSPCQSTPLARRFGD